MRQQDTRAVIALTVAALTACLPVASACDSCHDDDDDNDNDNGISQQTVTAIVVTCVVLVILLIMSGGYIWWWRRRLRAWTIQLDHDGMRKQSSNQAKPSSAPGHPVHYQAIPSAPPSAHMTRYLPRGYDTHKNTQSQRPSSSNAYTIPEPVSPISPRAPSNITSRPTPSLDTSPPLRSSARQDDPTTNAPRTPIVLSPASPRSADRNVIEPPLPPLPSSPQPRSPSAVILPPALGAPTLNPARPSALSPSHTGASKNSVNGAPPPYTPI